MIQLISTLKAWFQTADKPTQAQFAALIDSMMHRTDGDNLALDRVQGLSDLLNNFVTTQQFTEALENIGQGGDGAISWGSIFGTLSNQVDLNNALNLRVLTSAIVDDLTTGGSDVPASAETVKILKGLIDAIDVNPSSSSTSIKEVSQIAHGFIVGDNLYHNGTEYVKSIMNLDYANNLSKSEFIVKSVEGVDDFTLIGGANFIPYTSETLENGDFIYLSQTTAGEITTTKNDSGFIQEVGIWINGILYFNPKEPLLLEEVAGPFDQFTDDFDLRVRFEGCRYEAEILVKGTNQDFVINSLVPSGIGVTFQPVRVRATNLSDNQIFSRVTASKWTLDTSPETLYTSSNERGETVSYHYGNVGQNYQTDALTPAIIELTGINATVTASATSYKVLIIGDIQK